MTDTATATAPPATCTARTGFGAGEWGEFPLWCSTRIGLITWTDHRGETQRACSRHRDAMLRRFPEAPRDASKCVVCKQTVIEELAISVRFGAGIGPLCHVCQERSDES